MQLLHERNIAETLHLNNVEQQLEAYAASLRSYLKCRCSPSAREGLVQSIHEVFPRILQHVDLHIVCVCVRMSVGVTRLMLLADTCETYFHAMPESTKTPTC